jgi:hypothetical protein
VGGDLAGFLDLLLLLTLGTTDVLDWAFSPTGRICSNFCACSCSRSSLDLVDIVKTLVFQGHVSARPGDRDRAARVSVARGAGGARACRTNRPTRRRCCTAAQYFLRSVASFVCARQLALRRRDDRRLTAITVLSQRASAPLLKQISTSSALP